MVAPRSANAKKLGVLGLASIVFYSVAGTPAGAEYVVVGGGPMLTIIGFLLMPLVWSIPEALVSVRTRPTHARSLLDCHNAKTRVALATDAVSHICTHTHNTHTHTHTQHTHTHTTHTQHTHTHNTTQHTHSLHTQTHTHTHTHSQDAYLIISLRPTPCCRSQPSWQQRCPRTGGT
jgi:hypothetical protein